MMSRSRKEPAAAACAVFSVVLSAALSQDLTVNYGTSDGTAFAADYRAINGVLTFAAGQTIKTITVPIAGDALDEPNETFYINLSGASGVTMADSQAWARSSMTIHAQPPNQ